MTYDPSKVTVMGVHPDDFDKLWKLGYFPCDGCDTPLSEPGFCQKCVDAANEKLHSWQAAATQGEGTP